MTHTHAVVCTLLLTITLLVRACDAHTIRTVSESVNEPEAKSSDFFPDWVPFKNKHGEELGEFFEIPKSKLKKRLALPVNFIMKTAAETDGDDYADRIEPDNDNDEYYEKKEWSDTQRLPKAVSNNNATTDNHIEISEINGLVDIITQRPTDTIVNLINNKQETTIDTNVEQKQENNEESKETEVTENENNSEENKTEEDKNEETTTKSNEETDYEETSSEKPKPKEKNQSESEAKKAEILSSVDELKERHAQEQRDINERVKEEELFKEERERENMHESDEDDKYTIKRKLKRIEPEYEEYDDTSSSSEEQGTTTTSTRKPPRRTTKQKGKNKAIEPGKLSVFKNPRLYMVEDEDNAEISTTARPPYTLQPVGNNTAERYSAKYRATPTAASDSDEVERISLLPDNDTDPAKPALFFPRKTSNKRRKSSSTHTPDVTDSYVAESGNTAEQITSASSVPDATATPSTAAVAAGELVTDAVSAHTHHEHKKTEDFDNEKGGGRDYHSEHEEDHEEHGKKAYEGVHKDTKTAKGHHDKENHHGEYDDHAGTKEDHHDESAHYGSHHHEEHGKKNAKYEESGKHAKGHSTKGSHDIHKKEEYEKNVEFFEEEGDSGEEERHGGHHSDREHKEGGHFKKGGLEGGHHEHAHGEAGHFHEGGREHKHQGHQQSGGHDGHGNSGHSEREKAGRDSRRKWTYHHAHPGHAGSAPRRLAAAADARRVDYIHGPRRYG